MPDPSPGHLDELAPWTAQRAFLLLYAARTAGYPLIITSSRRSREEQERLVRAGRSLTMESRHLTGDAFDIDLYGWAPDDVPLWFWFQIGEWAEANLQLRWGGRWSSLRDYRHFEAPYPTG